MDSKMNHNLMNNPIICFLVINIFILLTLNLCLRFKILKKIKEKRIQRYQKLWSQVEKNEHKLTRRF